MPKDSTVKDLEELYKQGKSAKSALIGVWYMNLAYYEGQQWMAWDGRQLFKPSLRRSRITVVDNRIQPCVRTEIAKMTKNRPVFVVSPRTSDEEDANAAELAEQVMRYLHKHLKLHELTIKALHWSRITGAGFLKVFWDPSIGDGVDVLVNQGQVLTNPQGAPVRHGTPEAQLAMSMSEGVQVKRIAQGDVRVEVRSPFQMGVDPLADSFSEAEWVVEDSIKSPEYLKQRYGVDIPADTPANPGMIEARLLNGVTPGSASYKGVRVREYWSRPSTTHPNGRRAVWVPESKDRRGPKGQVLFEDDKPFDPMPYVMLSGIPVPGRLWPTSIVEQLRGPQTELNKIESQIAENRNRVGNPTILASRQAIADPEKFVESTTMPGGVHFFDDVGSPNARPVYLEAPPLPDYVIESKQSTEESIQEISGQHEVTSAQVPPGVTAASAINLLQEADDTRLGPAITDYEHQLGILGTKILKLVAKFYTDARTIRLSGDNGAWQIFDFRGAMMRDNTQVEVQAGSAFPQSKSAKQAAMQDLLTFFVQSGNPPHGRQLAQFLKDWEVGGADRLIEDYTRDETQVNRENAKLMQGIPVPINEFDNDQAHIDGHEDEQKTQRYDQQPPQIKQLFEQHVDMHRQRAAQIQQQQMQLQMQMQGQPPPEQQQAQQQQEMQGQAQQQDLQAQQQVQQMNLKGAQQSQQHGFTQAQSEQGQRHAEELHQQKLRHAEEQHQNRLRQMAEQARQQQRQGAQSGGRK